MNEVRECGEAFYETVGGPSDGAEFCANCVNSEIGESRMLILSFNGAPFGIYKLVNGCLVYCGKPAER